MKKLSCLAALLLGLAFVVFGLNFWLHFLPAKPAPAPESFMGLLVASRYFPVIKALEVIGGVLLILPRTRVLGLILVSAILFNIAAVHQFFFGGLKDPTVIGLIVLALVVVWSKRCALCCVNSCGCSSGCGCGTNGGCACGSTDKPASTGCCGGK